MEVYVESFTPQMSEDELSSSNIVAYSFCARVAPSSVDYDEMLQSCIERSASIVNALDKIGYKMWLLMAGFAFTPVQQSKFPNYSLFKAAEKCGLPRDNAFELTFRRQDRLRTAGLYESETTISAPYVDFFPDVAGRWASSLVDQAMNSVVC